MRLTAIGPWRTIAVVVSAAAFLVAALLAPGKHSTASSSRATSFVAATEGQDGKPHFRPEARTDLGRFRLARGHQVSVSTAETLDGKGCLVEGDDQGETSSCLEGGLFSSRKAELIVSSMGGPERFDELHLTGVVAPDIRSVRLVKTDGTDTDLQLNAHRAFVYQSSAGDLASKVYPSALRLFGPSGKLVETVDFPAAG